MASNPNDDPSKKKKEFGFGDFLLGLGGAIAVGAAGFAAYKGINCIMENSCDCEESDEEDFCFLPELAEQKGSFTSKANGKKPRTQSVLSTTLDLHGKTCRDHIERNCEKFINRHRKRLSRDKARNHVVLTIITGKGNYSVDNKPVLKPRVEKWLEKQGNSSFWELGHRGGFGVRVYKLK